MTHKRTETPKKMAHDFVEIFDLFLWHGLKYSRKQTSRKFFGDTASLVVSAAQTVLSNAQTMEIIGRDHAQVKKHLEKIQKTLAENTGKQADIDWLSIFALEVFGRAYAAEGNSAFGASQAKFGASQPSGS